MKKFEFRLQTALRLRQAQLETERASLHKFVGEKQKLRESLQSIAAERLDAAAFVQKTPDIVNTDLRALSAFLIGAQHRTNMINESLSRLDLKISDQRRKVIEAERKVRLLEKVKERKFAQWKVAVDRETEAAAQEAWNSRHAKGVRSKTQ